MSARRAAVLLLAALAGCEAPALLVPTEGLLRDVYVRGAATVPSVALTFDDGPNGRCTAAILDVLAASRTPATFFVLGHNVERGSNAALVARMVREGHTIGLHGWAHSTILLLDAGWARHDIERARDTVVAAVRAAGLEPPAIRFYRPPYGLLTGPAVRAAHGIDLEVVEWTLAVEDWRPGWTAAQLGDTIAADARPGDVIVLHDGDETAQRSDRECIDRRVQVEALARLVPALAQHGLHVAPLDEVIAAAGSH